MYYIKKRAKKDSVDYTLSKLLMNSLYGKFGMSTYKARYMFVKGKENIANFVAYKDKKVLDLVNLGNNI